MPANLEIYSAVATGQENISFHFNCKERQYQRMFTLTLKIAFISHVSKVMLKILKARLQQYENQEPPDEQTGFQSGRGIGDQIAIICWITEKAREFQKNIYFWFIDYIKAFDCVDHNKLWKILEGMGIPNHLTCLLTSAGAASSREATPYIQGQWGQL